MKDYLEICSKLATSEWLKKEKKSKGCFSESMNDPYFH